jgi:exoribonuclease II
VHPINNRGPKVNLKAQNQAPQKNHGRGKKEQFANVTDSVGASWSDQLAAVKTVLVAREELGISSAVNSKEAGEIIEKVLNDKTPTEDLGVIADRQMAENGMLPSFTSQVVEAAAAIKESPKPDHECVVDLRHLPMISVDNGDLDAVTGKLKHASKDIDQCEYAEKMPNGNIRMMVAIADVDSAVQKGDVVDNQAMRHGATVYTDDKIFPMLPRNLSEDLTSLNEGVDRLATIKEFQVTPEGNLVEPKIYRGHIHNRAQMAYDSVNEYLVDGSGPRPPQLQDETLVEQIELQDEAAQRLRHFFHSKGSLDIESSEARVTMNDDGKIIGMKKETQTRAKDKVKFNMMAANITTMSVLEEAGLPTLRRIVTTPTPEKWSKIRELAGTFDYKLPSDCSARSLNAFLESRKEADPGAHEELCANVVRLVGRGEYIVSTPGEPIEGHFALAAPEYGHTTAPNRRAPDLVNQRIEKAYAQGDECPYSAEELTQLAEHFNAQESAIKKVERRVHRSASAKLMKDMIGQNFDGRVHKELPIGTLVRLKEPFVTGLVHKVLEGESGDEVRVKLDGVNVEKGQIDFSLASEQLVDGFVIKP